MKLPHSLPGLRSGCWPASQSSSLQRFNHDLARQRRNQTLEQFDEPWPVIPTAAIMASAMKPAMMLYSMAVAALSSRRNFPNIRSLSNFDENGVARPSCHQYNQKRKIAYLSGRNLELPRNSIAFGGGLFQNRYLLARRSAASPA